jgi:hypothetical protein
MALYLNILEGSSPSEAVPILATRDPELIAAVARALSVRLGAEAQSRVLQLVREQLGPNGGDDSEDPGRSNGAPQD